MRTDRRRYIVAVLLALSSPVLLTAITSAAMWFDRQPVLTLGSYLDWLDVTNAVLAAAGSVSAAHRFVPFRTTREKTLALCGAAMIGFGLYVGMTGAAWQMIYPGGCRYIP